MESRNGDGILDDGVTRREVLKAGSAGLLALGVAGYGPSAALAARGKGADRSSGPALSEGPPLGGTPVRGGTLRIAVVGAGAAETLSPVTGYQNADILRIYSLYDFPFIQAPYGTTVPGLVEHATVSANAKVWTFHLRRGVVFHNGKDFTADDMEFTIKHMWGSPQNVFNVVLRKIIDFAAVKKLDKYTVRVPLHLGVAQFPTVLCNQNCPVVQNGETTFTHPVGTGPYKYKSFQPGTQSTFVANRDYWRGHGPYVDSLVIDSSFAEPQACLNALLAGDIDIYPNADPAVAAANAQSGQIVIGNQRGPGFMYLVQRVDQGGALGDPRVRKALKLIPDRSKYPLVALNGYGSVGNDLPGYTNEFFASDLIHKQDLHQARSLLKAAGYPHLSLTLPVAAEITGLVEMATLFKQDALGAGVTINIVQKSPSTYSTPAGGYLSRAFGVNYYTTGVNSLAGFYLGSMATNAPFNESHWAGANAPAFGPKNSLLFDALAETESKKAADKWRAVQEINFNEGPYVVPMNMNWVDAYSSKVRGVHTTPTLNCNGFDFSGAWLKA